jgi:antitoxin YefM
MNGVYSVRAIKPMDLRNNQKEMLDLAFEGEILIVARPAKKNVVVLSESEFNKREKALRNAEYLAKLDRAVEDARENGAYEYFGDGNFSDTLTKVNL